ncbi:hypothetical protein [Nesterenkonia populi]
MSDGYQLSDSVCASTIDQRMSRLGIGFINAKPTDAWSAPTKNTPNLTARGVSYVLRHDMG